MKFNSKVHPLNLLVHILLTGLCLFGIYYASILFMSQNSGSMLFAFLIVLVSMLLILKVFTPLFKTNYLVLEEKLIVNFGRDSKEIQYKDMLVISKSHKWFTLNCLSINKLELIYNGNNVKETIYMSPKKEEQFVKELKLRAKSLKVEKGLIK